jgi:hypothetical protein
MKRLLLVLSLVGISIFSQGVCQRVVAELISVRLEGTANGRSWGHFAPDESFSGYFTYDSEKYSPPSGQSPKGNYDALSLSFSIGNNSWSLLACKTGRIDIFHSTDHDQLSVGASNKYWFDNTDKLEGPFLDGMIYGLSIVHTDPTHALLLASGIPHTDYTQLRFPTDPSNLNGKSIYWGFSIDSDNVDPPDNNAEGNGTILVAGPATPLDLTKHLINTVVCLELPKNIENSYMANLKKVPSFLETGKTTPSINQLNAFIHKVQQDIAHWKISEDIGNDLINLASQLIAKIQS